MLVRPVEFPDWFQPFTKKATYKCVYGGRSASKTRTVAMWLVLQAATSHVRCACAREFHVTLDQSIMKALKWAIGHLGLDSEFDIQRNRIVGFRHDSEFFFAGVERNTESIKGWEGVTHAWFDEATRLSAEAALILIPTLARGDTPPEIWFTWNPSRRTDWVWRRFVVNPRTGDIIAKINWQDNPFLPDVAVEEIKTKRREDPAEYMHVWAGEPDDGNADTTVLPYGLITPCVDAWEKGLHLQAERTPRDVGLDIADAGADSNALCGRAGPVIERIETWKTHEPGVLFHTAKRAHDYVIETRSHRLVYDKSGVGAPIRGELLRFAPLPYSLLGENFGGAVEGKEAEFTRYQTNDEAFVRRNIQMAWGLRLRAMRTIRLLHGKDVDVNRCLFIPADLPRLEWYLAEMTQPVWRDNPKSGKRELDKRAESGLEKSPDRFDATCLAFARDSVAYGLSDL